jgi:3',5'-cyclic AMP phosphodiesterase CpdA
MIRIIHLSDLHVRSRKTRPENENASVLAGHLVERYSGSKKRNFVVITGDLVDDAKTIQYRHLERMILEKLRGKFTILAVPGNHDYARWGNHFDPRAPQRFRDRVIEIPAHPNPAVTPSNEDGERRILFVGVDSADPGDVAFFANGIVDQAQRARLADVLKEPTYQDYFKVIYVHHHPFLRESFVSFQEAEPFLELIRKKVDLVLFGHKHVHEPFFGRYGIPVMLASGKVTQPVGDALAFRVIDIEKSGAPAIYTVEVPSD